MRSLFYFLCLLGCIGALGALFYFSEIKDGATLTEQFYAVALVLGFGTVIWKMPKPVAVHIEGIAHRH